MKKDEKLEEIWRATAGHFGVGDERGSWRAKSRVRARRCAIAIMRLMKYSHSEIGRYFGLDHTSIMAQARKAETPEVVADVAAVTALLAGPQQPAKPRAATRDELLERLCKAVEAIYGELVVFTDARRKAIEPVKETGDKKIPCAEAVTESPMESQANRGKIHIIDTSVVPISPECVQGKCGVMALFSDTTLAAMQSTCNECRQRVGIAPVHLAGVSKPNGEAQK